MAHQRICPRGHQWEVASGEDPDDTACPLCSEVDGDQIPPPPVEMPSFPPPEIEGYEILGVLGSGGMGVVYKALDVRLQRLVAIKMIQPPPDTTPEVWQHLVRRFRTEAEAVARLQHPNIVQIHAIGEHHGWPYFSLEFCRGGSLEKELDGTPWEARRAARLVETLAHAVHAAHEANIVHRDLKPANVLLTEDGTPKVGDFGLAKKLDEEGHTQPGAVVGTASYMSPEQARGEARSVGRPTDVYALGAILYELLTGRPPFKADTTLNTLLQVVNDEPVPPRRLQPQVPRHLETICLHCLRKDPRRRYSTAQALAEDLRRFLDGRAPVVTPPGLAERTWLLYRRNKLTGTLLALLVVGTVTAMCLLAHFSLETGRANRDLQEAAYANHISLAHREYQANNIAGARRILEACLPGQQGWERDYLRRLCQAERWVLQGHEGGVSSVAVEAGSRWIASAGQDGTVRLWDLAAGREQDVLRGHDGEVTAVVFGPGGKVASAGADGTIRIWDPARGDGRILGRQKKKIGCLAYHPREELLAVGDDGGTVAVWDVAAGKERTSWPAGQGVRDLAFDREGKRLVVAADREDEGKTRHAATVWDIGGKKLFTFGAPAAVTGVAFDSGGTRIAVSCQAELVHLVDMETGKIRDLRGHASGVAAVAFGPDGKQVASAGWDGTVALWQLDVPSEDEEPILLRGHTKPPRAVVFSRDGRWLVSGGDDGAVRVWQVGVNPEHTVLGEAFVGAAGLAFRPDGKQVAAACWYLHKTEPGRAMTAGEVRLFDPAGSPRQEPLLLHGHRGELTAVAYAPEGGELATAGADGKLMLWDSREGVHLRTLEGHEGKATGVVFHPDGKQLISCGEDGAIRVWGRQKGDLLRKLEGHAGAVTSLAVSPDGRWLASGGADRMVRLWDLSGGEMVRSLEGHGDKVTAVAFSPDGTVVASGCSDHGVRLWDRETGRLRHLLWGHSGPVRSLAFHPGGRRLASAGGQNLAPGEIRLWDVEKGSELLALRNRSGPFTGVAFSPDGATLASVDAGGLREGEVRVWRTDPVNAAPDAPRPPKVRRRAVLSGHTKGVVSAAWSADGKVLATGSIDRTIRLWDPAATRQTGLLRGHEDAVWPVEILPDGRTLVSGAWDRTVRLWDLPSGKIRATLEHTDAVIALALSPDGRTLAAGARDGTVKVWDVPAGKLRHTLRGHEKMVTSLAFAPDGRTLATGSLDGTVKFWDPAGGKERHTIQALMNVFAVTFAPGGKVLATACGDGEPPKGSCVIKLWDTGTGWEQITLEGPKRIIRSLDYHPEAPILAAGTQAGELWLWDLRTRKSAAPVRAHEGTVFCVRFAPDGQTLATTGGDGAVHLWDVLGSP